MVYRQGADEMINSVKELQIPFGPSESMISIQSRWGRVLRGSPQASQSVTYLRHPDVGVVTTVG